MTRPARRGAHARAWAVGLAVAAAAAACSNAASNPLPGSGSAASSGATTRPGTTELLGSMATLVGLVADPAHLAEWAAKIDGGQASVDAYLDEILATDRFAGEVVPSLLFGAYVNVRNYYAVPSAFVLKRSADDGPLYLRAPCTPSEAIAVRPWWSFDTEVKVCPDAYRPDKWTLAPKEHSYKTAMTLACDSQVGSPELETHPLCGCGPNLIRCLRDEDQYNELNRSFMDEIKRTTAYVVQHDLPMATLFTDNSTFRDRNAELYYRRQKIGALEIKRVERVLADLAEWPQGGQWAPREELRPGQHAGVLTAPQILHWLPDQRQRQRAYYEIMWCNLRNSFGATTHKVLELNSTGNNFFVHDSWQRLAHTELCTNCHARLDYGSQFFKGYPDSRASTHYNPALQTTGTGPLYGRDIQDHRGDAPLTPVSFAKLATEQPDFKGCMTNHFVSYVLGDRATDDDVQAIETAVEQTRTFKASMKVALGRYAARWREETRAAPAPAAAVAAADPGPGPRSGVAVGPALRAKLDQHCVDCHDKAPYSDTADSADLPVDFRGGELPRPLLVSMTDQVAFGMMPKDHPFDPPVREEFASLLIDTLWTDPVARTEARRYYLGRARGMPAHQIDNALYTIDSLASAPSEIAWGALERGIWSDQATITPGFLATTGLEAVRACARAVQAGGGTLEDCLLRAVSLSALSRWPAPAPAATPSPPASPPTAPPPSPRPAPPASPSPAPPAPPPTASPTSPAPSEAAPPASPPAAESAPPASPLSRSP
ncbi:MAG TPA: hypothetical protein VN253_23025 [Kofleriaceae bacterium]|nr:hypothetical protein [Kofleriaceae bacterium]